MAAWKNSARSANASRSANSAIADWRADQCVFSNKCARHGLFDFWVTPQNRAKLGRACGADAARRRAGSTGSRGDGKVGGGYERLRLGDGQLTGLLKGFDL